MYIILGNDQKEYGPVSEAQMREWIAQRRANGATQIKPQGEAVWRPLSSFPEFTGALNAQPTAASGAGDALTQAVLARSYSISAGDCLSRGWAFLQQHFALLAGTGAVAVIITVVVESIPVVGPLANFFLIGPLWGGLAMLFLRRYRGRAVEFGDMFAGFSQAVLPLMLAGLLTQLLTALGLLLLIIPGVYLAVSWCFVFTLVMDKRLDFWPAMELSRKAVGKIWWSVFGLGLVQLLLVLIGVVALFVGIFLAVPLVMAMSTCAYEDIFGEPRPPAAAV